MNFALITMVISTLLFMTTCRGGGSGTSQCATDLTYVTNRFTSGEQALRHASEYRAHFLMGSMDFTVKAIVDTASANLVINESNFDYGDETTTGYKPMLFDNGHAKSVALNAKDTVDVACIDDFSARFSLTAKEQATPNYLGLAYSDPEHRPHEGKSAPFFDQLVKNEGFDNVFSLALCGPKGHSRLNLGGIDARMASLVGNFIPIIERTAYVVPALNLRRADNKKILGKFPIYDAENRTGTRTIIDSATSFLMLPSPMAIATSNDIANEARALGLLNRFPDGFFRTERFNSTKVIRFANLAQIRQFPTLEITFLGFDGKKKILALSPLHYFKQIDNQDPMLRTFAIREASGDIILGQPFLENHFAFFDRANGRIGFGNIDLACAE